MNKDGEITKPNCVFCGKPLSIPLLKNITANEMVCNVSECAECQIAMMHPFPTDKEISDLYSTGGYRTDGGTRFNFLIEYLIYLGSVVKRKRIEKYARKGKILDIGCGRGLFLDIMRRGEWEVVGSELNKETASYAEQVYGLEVHAGEITEQSLASECFEVINICGVLEHLKDPNAVISECYRLLKEDGLIVILVQNIRSFEFKLGKENWFHLDLPFHLFQFTEEGMVRVLQKKGFKIRKVKRFFFEYSPFGWLQTLLNLSKIQFNLFYDLLKSGSLKKNKKGKINLKGVLATLLLLPIYFPLALLFSALEPIIFKRGGIIQIYASKETI